MATQDIVVVHAIPGRLRLKVAKIKGDPALARKAQNALIRVPGVKQVEAQPLTGSVLIHYELAEVLTEEAAMALTDAFSRLFPEIDTAALVRGIESLLEHLASGGALEPTVSLRQTLTALSTKMTGLLGDIDLRLLIPLTLLTLGLRSLLISKPRPLPSWYDYFWYGFSTFFILNPRRNEAWSNQPQLVPERVAPEEQITRH
jgi:hypothetical protein